MPPPDPLVGVGEEVAEGRGRWGEESPCHRRIRSLAGVREDFFGERDRGGEERGHRWARCGRSCGWRVACGAFIVGMPVLKSLP